MRKLLVGALALFAGCQGQFTGAPSDGGGVADGGVLLCDAPDDDAGARDDVLPPARVLRRAALALTGAPPTDDDYGQLAAAGDEAAQRAFVSSWVDQHLTAPEFYRSLYEFGRDWFALPLVPSTADAPEYGPQQQRSIQRCGASTPNAGKWAYVREDYEGMAQICSGVLRDGGAPAETVVEPWFQPGSTITLVGSAANLSDAGVVSNNGTWVTAPCNGIADGTCGCGPHAASCHGDFQTYAGWEDYLPGNEHGQRRQLTEEPARLFAHLAFNDRSMAELITGTTMVGTTKTISAYVMQGVHAGDLTMLGDDSWWQPSKFQAAPHDPYHQAGDPDAWREFDLPTISRVFIADRAYHYDPRTEHGPMQGLPAAGMLTSMGFLAAQPRERLRAARMLEQLACEVLSPPSGQTFNPYVSDPGREGPCQNCHRRIDPSAIHFKRFAKTGQSFEGFGADYVMPAIGRWQLPRVWRAGAWPYLGEPYAQWNRWYRAGSVLTPVTQAEVDQDPMTVFIDFLPPDQTLLGQVSDGTVGPLGFAKLIIAAGAYDRCVVRHLHQFVMGRDVDPSTEAGYLDALTAQFIAQGRQARPFIKTLTQSSLFSRGF
jgi:hypothetical protein